MTKTKNIWFGESRALALYIVTCWSFSRCTSLLNIWWEFLGINL